MDELIIDNFAGGGGTSTGIELATGRPVDIAINHDESAIAMHKANHPFTEHYTESVWNVDPREATNGRPVALAWFSPDCKHFSKAKGSKPVDKKIRGLAWVAVRWAATVHPRVIILENVEEFKTWGPVLDGKPVKNQAGRTFKSFVNALTLHGYKVDWRELRACDYGAPTIRKRFFLIARCDGQPIRWPEPTHGAPDSDAVKSGRLKPWRTAAEIIDWTLPCPSIFDTSKEIREKYGRTAIRPLADSTLRRIARGLRKFVFENPEPFIVDFKYDNGPKGMGDPLRTITGANGYGIVTPTLVQYHGEQSNREVRGQAVDNPLLTADAANRYGLVTSHMVKLKGKNIGHTLTEPTQTITAGGTHFGEVRAFLVKYYGQGIGQTVNEPLHTVTGKDTFGVVTIHGEQYRIADIGMRMLTARELFNAQGFPPDYIIDIDPEGKKISGSAQIARCGNAVPPPFAEALVRANLPELCGRKITNMEQLHREMAV